jgi:uncharacterized protein YjeT (DUF2065 family)
MDSFWMTLGMAFGLMLVIEGLLYSLFASSMRQMQIQIMALPPSILQRGGFFAILVGCFIIWAIRG